MHDRASNTYNNTSTDPVEQCSCIREADDTPFRLIGLGAHPLQPAAAAQPDLADPEGPRGLATQRAVDALRERFGPTAIYRGRSIAAAENEPLKPPSS